MTEPNGFQTELGNWQYLKQQAISGELWMEQGVADQMVENCDNFIRDMEVVQRDAEQLGYLSGYGQLPSALAMKAKFEAKAVGGGPHDPRDNAVTRVKEIIAIARVMRDTYAAAGRKIEQTDQQTAQDLGKQSKGLR